MQSKKFGSGGMTRPDVQKVNKSKTQHGKMTFFKEGGDTMASKMNAGMMAMMAKKKGTSKMAGGGMAMGKVKTAAPSRDGIAEKGKTKGTMIAMKMGGMTKKMNKGGKAC